MVDNMIGRIMAIRTYLEQRPQKLATEDLEEMRFQTNELLRKIDIVLDKRAAASLMDEILREANGLS